MKCMPRRIKRPRLRSSKPTEFFRTSNTPLRKLMEVNQLMIRNQRKLLNQLMNRTRRSQLRTKKTLSQLRRRSHLRSLYQKKLKNHHLNRLKQRRRLSPLQHQLLLRMLANLRHSHRSHQSNKLRVNLNLN